MASQRFAIGQFADRAAVPFRSPTESPLRRPVAYVARLVGNTPEQLRDRGVWRQ